MNQIDLPEIAAIFGVLLLGLALFMAWGAPAVVGYAGGVLIVLAVALHYNRQAQPESDKDA